MDERNRLILEEARTAASLQRDDLQKIRDRVSSILSAGGLIATFFGALALRDDAAPLTAWIYIAAATVSLLAVLAIYIHWPREFIFTNDPNKLLNEWSLDDHDGDQWLRFLAEYLDENYTTNATKITRLMCAYVAALLAFGAEVVLLGVDLALR